MMDYDAILHDAARCRVNAAMAYADMPETQFFKEVPLKKGEWCYVAWPEAGPGPNVYFQAIAAVGHGVLVLDGPDENNRRYWSCPCEDFDMTGLMYMAMWQNRMMGLSPLQVEEILVAVGYPHLDALAAGIREGYGNHYLGADEAGYAAVLAAMEQRHGQSRRV